MLEKKYKKMSHSILQFTRPNKMS